MKAKVQATRTKTMVLELFYSQGAVYNQYIPKGKTVSSV
jgi:hypothetical protein